MVTLVQQLSLWVVPWLPQCITPNGVTTFALSVGVGIGFVASQGYEVLAVLGILFNCWLDCVDGDLARYRRKTSVLGEFMDHSFDSISISCILYALCHILEWPPMFVAVFAAFYVLSLPAITVGQETRPIDKAAIENIEFYSSLWVLGYVLLGKPIVMWYIACGLASLIALYVTIADENAAWSWQKLVLGVLSVSMLVWLPLYLQCCVTYLFAAHALLPTAFPSYHYKVLVLLCAGQALAWVGLWWGLPGTFITQCHLGFSVTLVGMAMKRYTKYAARLAK